MTSMGWPNNNNDLKGDLARGSVLHLNSRRDSDVSEHLLPSLGIPFPVCRKILDSYALRQTRAGILDLEMASMPALWMASAICDLKATDSGSPSFVSIQSIGNALGMCSL